jgi:hypothetical protein
MSQKHPISPRQPQHCFPACPQSFTVKSLLINEKIEIWFNSQNKYIKPKETRIAWPRSVAMSPAHVAAEKSTSGAA